MAFNTELITSAQVIAECIPDTNFDKERLNKFIFSAQLHYVEPAVGETFYETLLSEKAADSFSAENQLLYDNFLRPMLCWFVLFDAFPFIRNHITPKGIMVNDNEFSQQSSKDDYAGLRNAASVMGERWKGKMDKYIRDVRESDSSAFSDYNRGKDKHQNKTGFIFYGGGHGHHGHHHINVDHGDTRDC